jgi:dephospho-CoA kinase|tara:strand:+ start:806 stop:1369 length:564 start_codon:yes stop_codon:yes gene_type:complete
MIIGITGIFQAGKTTVAQLITSKGYTHIDADAIGHEVLDEPLIKERLVQTFGPGILDDGFINRKKLGRRAFKLPESLQQLNTIVHPKILETIRKKTQDKEENIVLDAPLLFETNLQDICDKVIAVTITPALQEARAKDNDWEQEDLDNINKAQWPQEKKEELADFTIQNNGNSDDLKLQVDVILQSL